MSDGCHHHDAFVPECVYCQGWLTLRDELTPDEDAQCHAGDSNVERGNSDDSR